MQKVPKMLFTYTAMDDVSVTGFGGAALIPGADRFGILVGGEWGRVAEANVLELALTLVTDPTGCLMVFTDQVLWLTPEDIQYKNDTYETKRLLEMRLYSWSAEFHALRSLVGAAAEFTYRLQTDAQVGPCGEDLGQSGEKEIAGFVVDEIQYLDIALSKDGVHRSTTGGWFSLPSKCPTRLLLRNYYEFDTTDGIAAFVGFRIVGLDTKGE